MNEANVTSAKVYYKAMRNKDLASMAHYLHCTAWFLGPLAEVSGKEAIVDFPPCSKALQFEQNLALKMRSLKHFAFNL